MNHEEIVARLDKTRATYGPWKRENILLPHGVWTKDDSPKQPRLFIKRIIESISAVSKKPLSQCRILDLAPGEGASTVECALQGAQVTVVEAREENLERIQAVLDCYGVTDQVTLTIGDVRSISEDVQGRFDIVLCCGILYHLDAKGVHEVVNRSYKMADDLIFIDTHISLAPNAKVILDDDSYEGWYCREHVRGATKTAKEAAIYSSIDNETSFWFSRVSLINMLMRAGYQCVVEVLNTPMPRRPDRCSFVGVKSQAVSIKIAPEGYPTEFWDEGTLDYGRRNDTRIRSISLVGRVRRRLRKLIRS